MNKQFYLQRDGIISGPFPPAKILLWLRAGNLSAQDAISLDKKDWQGIGQVSWLNARFIPADVPDLSLLGELPATPAPAPILAAVQPTMGAIPTPPAANEFVPESCPTLPIDTSLARQLGDAISLAWNSSDNLPKIHQRYGSSGEWLAFASLTALAVVLTCAFSAIFPQVFCNDYSAWSIAWRSLLVATCWAICLPAASLSLRLLWGGSWQKQELSSNCLGAAVLLLNLAGGYVCALALLRGYDLAGTAMRTMLVGLLFFCSSFFLANSLTALRITYISFAGCKPRTAVWLSAILLTLNAWALAGIVTGWKFWE